MATGENQEARGKGNCSFPGLAVHLLKTGTMPGHVQVRPEEAQGGVPPLLKLRRRVVGKGWAATRWWGQGQGWAVPAEGGVGLSSGQRGWKTHSPIPSHHQVVWWNWEQSMAGS